MTKRADRGTALHRFAIVTAVSTFLLIIAGGLVTSTGSGLSVPDWPNTYGHFMFSFPLDKMVGGIFYEHGHRMIASVVGLLILILAIWLWRREERRWVRVLGFVALGGVVVQGVLGGLTVLFLLPTAISVSHAALAQTVFSILVVLALVTSPWWRGESEEVRTDPGTMKLVRMGMWTTITIFIQLILGAVMRHVHAGLAIPDLPLAFGQLVPSLSDAALMDYNARLVELGLRSYVDGPITAGQISVHLLHRFWALVVVGMVVHTTIRLLRFRSRSRRLALFGYPMILLLLLQVTLGVLTVLTRKAVDITTAHVATGALLLAVSLLQTLHAYRISGTGVYAVAESGMTAETAVGGAAS